MTPSPNTSMPSGRADLAGIPRYTAGMDAATIDLGSNTNLWGSPPAAATALRAPVDVSAYPDMYGDLLKQTVATLAGVPSECVVTGNGSDDILDCAIRAFAGPGDTIAHPTPTFGMVPIFARLNNVRPIAVPLTATYEMDAEALLATGARIIYLCSPNNPTATATPVEVLRDIIARAPGLVILDEAYAEFTNAAGLLSEAPALGRVLVCRTLSKAYGLAGLRAGYATASKGIVETVEKSRGPYKMNTLAQQAAVAALTMDRDWVAARAAEAVANRDRLAAELRTLGFSPLPSATNFLLVPTPQAETLAQRLYVQGIAIRAFRALPGIGDAFRITAAPWDIMERTLTVMREALA